MHTLFLDALVFEHDYFTSRSLLVTNFRHDVCTYAKPIHGTYIRWLNVAHVRRKLGLFKKKILYL